MATSGTSEKRYARLIAVAVVHGPAQWETLSAAAEHLGVSVQAVSQSIRLQNRTRGWTMEKVA